MALNTFQVKPAINRPSNINNNIPKEFSQQSRSLLWPRECLTWLPESLKESNPWLSFILFSEQEQAPEPRFFLKLFCLLI